MSKVNHKNETLVPGTNVSFLYFETLVPGTNVSFRPAPMFQMAQMFQERSFRANAKI